MEIKVLYVNHSKAEKKYKRQLWLLVIWSCAVLFNLACIFRMTNQIYRASSCAFILVSIFALAMYLPNVWNKYRASQTYPGSSYVYNYLFQDDEVLIDGIFWKYTVAPIMEFTIDMYRGVATVPDRWFDGR